MSLLPPEALAPPTCQAAALGCDDATFREEMLALIDVGVVNIIPCLAISVFLYVL